MRAYLIFVVLLGMFVVSPVAGQTCQPAGVPLVGPCNNCYDHIANGVPASTACWTSNEPYNVSLVTDTLCGWSSNAFDFTYGDSLTQTFTVPSNRTQTNWTLSYLLTFNDPNNDGWWNRLQARVFDATTGQFIAAQTYWGSNPDISCTLRTLSFTGNLAGHTLTVRFDGGRAYDNTTIRVRSISLWQQ